MPEPHRIGLSLEELDSIFWALLYYRSDMDNLARHHEERAKDMEAVGEAAHARSHKAEAEQARTERQKAEVLRIKIKDIRDTIRHGPLQTPAHIG